MLILSSRAATTCYRKGYILKKKTIDYNTANKNISHFNREDIDMGYELKNKVITSLRNKGYKTKDILVKWEKTYGENDY